jgi:hypothetical protein
VRVILDDVRSLECPKSRIVRHPAVADLIHINTQADGVRGALGPPSRWPAVFYDAVTAVNRAKNEDDAARKFAVSRA